MTANFIPKCLEKTASSGGFSSYPELSDPATKEILKVTESAAFPNTTLFKSLQRWMRDPTSFQRRCKRRQARSTACPHGKESPGLDRSPSAAQTKEHPMQKIDLLAAAVHRRFIEKGLTLSLAESCTGGSASAF